MNCSKEVRKCKWPFESPLKYTVPSLRAQLVGKPQSTRSYCALEIALQNYLQQLPSRHRSRLHVFILTLIKFLHGPCIWLSSDTGQVEEREVPSSSSSFCCYDKTLGRKVVFWLTDHSLLLREVKAGTQAEMGNRNHEGKLLPGFLAHLLASLCVLSFLNQPRATLPGNDAPHCRLGPSTSIISHDNSPQIYLWTIWSTWLLNRDSLRWHFTVWSWQLKPSVTPAFSLSQILSVFLCLCMSVSVSLSHSHSYSLFCNRNYLWRYYRITSMK